MFSAAAPREARRICQQISLAAARGGRDAGTGSLTRASARIVLPIFFAFAVFASAVFAARFRAAAHPAALASKQPHHFSALWPRQSENRQIDPTPSRWQALVNWEGSGIKALSLN
jgi:hypothetical protein